MTVSCNRQLLRGYLANQLELEDQLEFLFHVDGCAHCWDEVYNATKAQHPHFYKSTSRQVRLSRRELADDLEFREEIFEVA
jgi:phosphosulfolactate phosphohydrolase-like enzyme